MFKSSKVIRNEMGASFKSIDNLIINDQSQNNNYIKYYSNNSSKIWAPIGSQINRFLLWSKIYSFFSDERNAVKDANLMVQARDTIYFLLAKSIM